MSEYGLNPDTYEKLLQDCSDKVNRITDVDWSEIVEKYDLKVHPDTLRKSSQYITGGAFVSEYWRWRNSSSENWNTEYARQIEHEKRELKKEKQKLSDVRTDYNRTIRREARKESYLDMVKDVICKNVEPMPIKNANYPIFTSKSDLLVHLTDIHTGIEIDNFHNTFNPSVLRKRLEKYLCKIHEIAGINQSENCYIVIGEILSGIIHSNLRIQNNLDLMEQFKFVSELISAALMKLSSDFHYIYVYVTPGNHSRISPKKEEALDGENMDILLPFYLRARLQNVKNVKIMDNTINPEIAMFNIRGNTIFSSHGHKDNPQTVVQNLTMMFGIKPKIVLLGHRHRNALTTVYDAKVIESGCISGADEYALSKRKVTPPEQTVSVIDEGGLVCIYNIRLD